MVHPTSHETSRIPWYSGTYYRKATLFSLTRLSLSMAGLSRPLQLTDDLMTSRRFGRTVIIRPMTPNPQRLPAYARIRFRLFPVRSPLLRESQLMSFPAGNEMFHFPAFPTSPDTMTLKHLGCFWLPHSDIPGSKLARSSPRLFAARYVLRRLLLPRHSPCALHTFS